MLEGRYSSFAPDTEAREVQYTFHLVLQCKDKFGMDADSVLLFFCDWRMAIHLSI